MQGEGRGLRAYGEDAVFDAGGEEVGDGLFGDGEAFGLDECPGVLRDLVELVLKRRFERSGHDYIIAATSMVPWQEAVGFAVDDFFARVLLLVVGMDAVFNPLRRETRRVKPSSRAFLLPGTVLLGSSPARIKPWPAPS